MTRIEQIIKEAIVLKYNILQDEVILNAIEKSASEMIDCFENDGKVLFCGNGGSAADAQHLAAEFSGRFYYDRDPLYSEALHVNSSYLTAVANDYHYDQIYSRLIKAKGRPGDILVGISTSGNSKNIIAAMEQAKRQGMITMAFTGETGGAMKDLADILINIPSQDTPRIQECHIMVGHIICELVESSIFPKE